MVRESDVRGTLRLPLIAVTLRSIYVMIVRGRAGEKRIKGDGNEAIFAIIVHVAS